MPGFSVLRNLSYVTEYNGERTGNIDAIQKYSLDLYIPTPGNVTELSASTKPPIVIFIHGGGWRRGDRVSWKHMISSFDTNILFALIFRYFNLFSNVGSYFSKNGIACAVISYPLCFLKFPYYCFELLTSFLASFFLVFVFCFAANTISIGLFGYSFCIFSLNTGFNLIDTTLELIGISQIISWVIVYFNRVNYPKLTKSGILLPWIISAGTFFFIFVLYNDPLIARVVGLTLFTIFWQSIIVTQYLYQRETIGYKDQIKAVAQSLKWVKKFGEDSQLYNSSSIFLCGHSAGGHLASLLALNQKLLFENGIDQSDIKGIMPISAVYNLCILHRFPLQQIYLEPAFGNHYSQWQQASPLNYITNKQKSPPSFLVIFAEFDPILLKDDALQFVGKLQSNHISCNYYNIRKRNHFTIIFFANETLSKCVKFVKENANIQ